MSQIQAQRPDPQPEPRPPHPFRESTWYDPTRDHHPCQCPGCQADRDRGRKRSRPVLRIVLVVLGGVVLPLVSLAVNLSLPVVELGALGTGGILLSVASVLAHLLLSPRRLDPETGKLVHCPPRSTALRLALLWGALLSCLVWGYLALLFLPLLPVSVIAIIALGLGLCGLCPYGALTISLIHAVRDTRAVAARLPRRLVLAAMVASLAPPLLALTGAGLLRQHQRQLVQQAVQRIADQPPFSAARMQTIAALSGQQQRVVESYMNTTDSSQRALLAEIHLRLTDSSIHAPVQARVGRRHERLIRPWWFLDGGPSFRTLDLWRF